MMMPHSDHAEQGCVVKMLMVIHCHPKVDEAVRVVHQVRIQSESPNLALNLVQLKMGDLTLCVCVCVLCSVEIEG
jgi:hypothetical protein